MEVTINRPKQYADLLRAYKIKVDGVKVGEIKSGESTVIVIPDESRVLQVNLDFCLSNELKVSELNPNDTLLVKNSFSHKLWIPFVALYYVTIGRKKYLELSKAI